MGFLTLFPSTTLGVNSMTEVDDIKMYANLQLSCQALARHLINASSSFLDKYTTLDIVPNGTIIIVSDNKYY